MEDAALGVGAFFLWRWVGSDGLHGRVNVYRSCTHWRRREESRFLMIGATLMTSLPQTEIHTAVARIWRDPSGIIRGMYTAPTETIDDARTNMAAVRQLSNAQPALLLIDSRALVTMPAAVRTYYVSDEAARDIKTLAILVSTAASRFMGNLFLRFQQTHVPTKLFTDEALALRWLKSHRH